MSQIGRHNPNSAKCDEQCPHYRVGLPIFPVRYAVLPEECPLIPLDNDTCASDAEISRISLQGKGRYGLRVLRDGYIYIYDENSRKLEGYIVDNGLLLRMFLDSPLPPLDALTPPCEINTHRGAASCITIPNANKAKKPVWITFSDVQWTQEVIRRHRDDENVRKAHMTLFDVKQWWASGKHPGALKIDQLNMQVAEAALPYIGRKPKDDLAWSPVDVVDLSADGRTSGILTASELLAKGKGAILALPDPVGVAQDIGALMDFRFDQFVASNPDRARRAAVSDSILWLRDGIHRNAERQVLRKAEYDAHQAVYGGGRGEGGAGGVALARSLSPAIDKRYSELEESIRNRTTVTELIAARDEAWSRYQAKFNEAGRATFEREYKTELQGLGAHRIDALAKAHVAWMESDSLAKSLSGNFDDGSVDSGKVYAGVIALCIGNTQDKPPCYERYGRWLDGSLSDRRNLLGRALIYNLEKTAADIDAAVGSSFGWSAVPWDKLIQGHDNMAGRLLASNPAELGIADRILAAVAGPISKALVNAAAADRVYPVLAAMGVVKRMPLVRVSHTGSKKAFRGAVVQTLYELAEKAGGVRAQGRARAHQMNSIQQAVADELRLLRIHGLQMDGVETRHWLAFVDPAHVDAMPKGLSRTDRAAYLAKGVRVSAQAEAMQIAEVTDKLKSSVPVTLGVANLIAQHAALSVIAGSMPTSMAHDRSELGRRLAAQQMQFAGAYGEFIGGLAEKATDGRFALARSRSLNAVSKWTRIGGRTLGVVGSLVMSAFDAWKGFNEFSEKNFVAGGYYVSMSLIGLGATVLLAGWVTFGLTAAAATGVGLVLVALLIMGSLVAHYFVDDKIMDWLERVYEWGNLEKERYSSAYMESFQLKQALGRE